MKRGLTALAAALLAGTGLAGAAEAAPGLNWRPCAENAAVHCASVTVPIDWARPAKGTIDMAVARRPATGERIGTLVFLPGGPGNSGVDSMLTDGAALPPAVAARFDVVSYDPRGSHRSHPVRCDADVLASQPDVIPDSGATLAEVNAYSKRLGDSCRSLTGPLIDHIDSVSVARDIDALRTALGERKLSLYGYSYGTLAGQMYAENFPRRVRAMVLDSVFDHSLGAERFTITEARAAEDSFNQFAAWCAKDTGCALHGRDVGQVFDDLYARSVSGELPVPPMGLIQGTLRFFFGPDWPGAANWLSGLESSRATAAGPVPFPDVATCADHRFDVANQREWLSIWRKQKLVAPQMRSHVAWGAMSLCVTWPGRTGNPQHRLDIDGAPPILLMNARYDPGDAYAWATNVTRQIDDGVLLTYDGWGHGVLNRSDCTRNAVIGYLLAGTLPAPGTHCPAVNP